MNVFDKSLLFEMSFALMRRFAFIEVPAPGPEDFKQLITRSAGGDPVAREVTLQLLGVAEVKGLGPAIFMDIARYLFQRSLVEGTDVETLAFDAFYAFLLPQFEGLDAAEGEQLYSKLKPLVGTANRKRLQDTLNRVLGLSITSVKSAEADEGDYEDPSEESE
jgi:hypothetical protein